MACFALFFCLWCVALLLLFVVTVWWFVFLFGLLCIVSVSLRSCFAVAVMLCAAAAVLGVLLLFCVCCLLVVSHMCGVCVLFIWLHIGPWMD